MQDFITLTSSVWLENLATLTCLENHNILQIILSLGFTDCGR